MSKKILLYLVTKTQEKMSILLKKTFHSLTRVATKKLKTMEVQHNKKLKKCQVI